MIKEEGLKNIPRHLLGRSWGEKKKIKPDIIVLIVLLSPAVGQLVFHRGGSWIGLEPPRRDE